MSKVKPYDGFFITVEGGEGVGKTTLTTALLKELMQRGFNSLGTREPGGTALSEYIRTILLDTPNIEICERSELLLYLAARAQQVEVVILPALYEAKIVLCDRFHDSTIVYQGAARHLGMQMVSDICNLAIPLEPQLTFFLDLDPQEGLRRVNQTRSFDRLELEKLQFHKEVRQGYLHLADQYPERIKILDASKPAEQVLQDALNLLEPLLAALHRSQ